MSRTAVCAGLLLAACNGAGEDLPVDAVVDAALDAPARTSCAATVTARSGFTCVTTTAGPAWCWGANYYGALGDGTAGGATGEPRRFAAGGAVTAITAGNAHACARRDDGTVRCAGWNQHGQLGDGTVEHRRDPVEVVHGAGDALDAITALSIGGGHSCALDDAGTLWCWGADRNGILARDGDGVAPNPVAITGLASVVRVVAGNDHSCAITDDARLWCWGWNAAGQVGDGTTDTRIAPAPILDRVVAAAASTYRTCAVRDDGSVWCWGGGQPQPAQVAAPAEAPRFTAIATGEWHACAIGEDASLWCWGDNSAGQVQPGDEAPRPTPTRVVPELAVAAVAAGELHTCAVTTGGEVWCWGSNGTGALGNGTIETDQRHPPRPTLPLDCP